MVYPRAKLVHFFWEDDGARKNCCGVIRAYMKPAFSKSQSRIQVRAHKFVDASLDLAWAKETVVKYKNVYIRLIAFLRSSVKMEKFIELNSKVVSKQLETGVCGLLHCCEESWNPSKSVEHVHNILKLCLFWDGAPEEEVVPLFTSCYAVMCCGDNEGYRFGTPRELSSMFAALKYIACNVAVSELFVYPCADLAKGWK